MNVSRRTIFSIAAMVLLAAATQYWLQSVDDGPLPASRSTDLTSEYTLDDFTLSAMNDEGQLAFEVTAPRLEENPEDRSAEIQSPEITIYEASEARWQVQAQTGWISHDAKTLRLQGDVSIQRQSNSNDQTTTTIDTSDMTVFPKRQEARTRAPVEIRRPGLILSGVGMRANLRKERYQILSQVRVRYTNLAPPAS